MCCIGSLISMYTQYIVLVTVRFSGAVGGDGEVGRGLLTIEINYKISYEDC